MNQLFILLIILLVLFIFVLYYRNTYKESFIPNISSDTPEGSSNLYGWELPVNDYNSYSIPIPQIPQPQSCCPCKS